MTIAKSKQQRKKWLWITGGVAASGMLLAGFAWLVLAYNRNVNIESAIQEAKKDIEEQEVNNAELKDAVLTLFDASQLEKFAEERGLIKERNPRYLPIEETWVAVSH